jgi:hypothetical protein
MNEIDRLFKEGLHSLEKKPSAQAWEKIAKKQTNKRPIWIFSGAAAAVVLLATTYLFVNYQNTPINDQIASQLKLDSTEEAHQEPVIKPKPLIAAAELIHLAPLKEKISNERIKKSGRVKNEELPVPLEHQLIDNQVDPLDKVTILEEMESHSDSDQKKQFVSTSKPLELSREAHAVNESEKALGLTLIVDVKLPELEPVDAEKNTKLGKVLKQLKNARSGDKIDWVEIGLKKDREFAKK